MSSLGKNWALFGFDKQRSEGGVGKVEGALMNSAGT